MFLLRLIDQASGCLSNGTRQEERLLCVQTAVLACTYGVCCAHVLLTFVCACKQGNCPVFCHLTCSASKCCRFFFVLFCCVVAAKLNTAVALAWSSSMQEVKKKNLNVNGPKNQTHASDEGKNSSRKALFVGLVVIQHLQVNSTRVAVLCIR